MDDLDTLARTICGEARGEGIAGMEDVACVVMNRCEIAKHYLARNDRRHPLYGDGSPASACLAPWQFSCWNEGDPNRFFITALTENSPLFRDCLTVAQSAIARTLQDRTQAATHYYDRRLKTPPQWAEGKTPCFAEGHHLFFNDIN